MMKTTDASPCLDDKDPDFQYKNANDSHTWLTNYPGTLKPDPIELKISQKNETFVEHEIKRGTIKGKRKQLLEDFYRKLLTDEIIKAFEEDKIIVEDYKTDYMESFKHPDDMPLPGEVCSKNEKLKKTNETNNSNETSKDPKLEELKAKYPLYLSTPLTFFSQSTGRSHFRKNSTITKSPDQNYDNIEY